ncbi:MAG TPA: hypothetical protein VFW83_05435 [Bryobacteraceae bacterium]|nr:hypothetical protein [Bryobacteraceae bacterium]
MAQGWGQVHDAEFSSPKWSKDGGKSTGGRTLLIFGEVSGAQVTTASEASARFGQTTCVREPALPYWLASLLQAPLVQMPKHQRQGPPGDNSTTCPLML